MEDIKISQHRVHLLKDLPSWNILINEELMRVVKFVLSPDMTPSLEEITDEKEIEKVEEMVPAEDDVRGKTDFLNIFQLSSVSKNSEEAHRHPVSHSSSLFPLTEKEAAKAPNIPFSSPAGQILTKSSVASPTHIKNCEAQPDTQLKIPNRKTRRSFKKPWLFNRMKRAKNYKWPSRNYYSYTRDDDFNFLHRDKIQKLKPCSVNLERLTEDEINSYEAVKDCDIVVKSVQFIETGDEFKKTIVKVEKSD